MEDIVPMTRARRSVLQAIDKAAGLADPRTVTGRSFVAVYSYEDTDHMIPESGEPSLAEMPALDVRWQTGAAPQWIENAMLRFMCSLELKMWLPGNSTVAAEKLFSAVIRAVFQTRPSATEDLYVAIGTGGYLPEIVGFQPPTQMMIGANKETKATLTILRLGLNVQFDPLLQA